MRLLGVESECTSVVVRSDCGRGACYRVSPALAQIRRRFTDTLADIRASPVDAPSAEGHRSV